MKVINHRFTLREKILLIVLVAILFLGVYFLLVYYPINRERAELQQRQEDLAFKKVVADANKTIYDDMQDELKAIYALPVDERTEIPKFENKDADGKTIDGGRSFLRKYFDGIFEPKGLIAEIRWGSSPTVVEENSNILARTLNITFSLELKGDETESYTSMYSLAKTIIGEILNVGEEKEVQNDDGSSSVKYVHYRCLMNNVSISPAKGDIQSDAVTVTCAVTFYERTK